MNCSEFWTRSHKHQPARRLGSVASHIPLSLTSIPDRGTALKAAKGALAGPLLTALNGSSSAGLFRRSLRAVCAEGIAGALRATGDTEILGPRHGGAARLGRG